LAKADVTLLEVSTCDPLLESSWSKLATPGLAEETELISSPPNVISAAIAITARLLANIPGVPCRRRSIGHYGGANPAGAALESLATPDAPFSARHGARAHQIENIEVGEFNYLRDVLAHLRSRFRLPLAQSGVQPLSQSVHGYILLLQPV
jgi:hypothetical protein